MACKKRLGLPIDEMIIRVKLSLNPCRFIKALHTLHLTGTRYSLLNNDNFVKLGVIMQAYFNFMHAWDT